MRNFVALNKKHELCLMVTTPLFAKISFDGTAYYGWQIQPEKETVQGEIESALTQLNGNKAVAIIGCGRTDAGVHAHEYFISFEWPSLRFDHLLFKLNRMLPHAIKVHWIEHKSIHARFDAKRRTYRYFINKEKQPFEDQFRWTLNRTLDIATMNEACQGLIGTLDFASFAKGDSDVKNTLCDVSVAFWTETDSTYIFEIEANRFLRNMVRALVGTTVEVGLGNLSVESFLAILSKKDRQEASTSAPAKGLFLWRVVY